jgi:hypothetical protein
MKSPRSSAFPPSARSNAGITTVTSAANNPRTTRSRLEPLRRGSEAASRHAAASEQPTVSAIVAAQPAPHNRESGAWMPNHDRSALNQLVDRGHAFKRHPSRHEAASVSTTTSGWIHVRALVADGFGFASRSGRRDKAAKARQQPQLEVIDDPVDNGNKNQRQYC